jgi:carbon storage regulator
MLVLSRKAKQTIRIGSDVVLTVVSVQGNRVKIGIEAPKHVRVVRQELLPFESETWGGVGFDAEGIGHESQIIPDAAFPAR